MRDWDGKATAPVEVAYDSYSSEPGFVDELIAMSREPALQTGATWLLKRHVETTGRLGAKAELALWRAVGCLETWPAKLHVLQCVPHLPIPDAALAEVGDFVTSNLDAEKAFVRAWAYGALYVLAKLEPARFEEEARRRFERARKSEAASVRARLRKLGVAGF